MADPLKLVQGDLRPYWVGWLEQPEGVPIPDLSQASEIRFLMASGPEAALIVDSPTVEVLDEPTAKVRYRWLPGDTDVQGQFDVKIVIIWPGNEPLTVPTDGFDRVSIGPNLGPP